MISSRAVNNGYTELATKTPIWKKLTQTGPQTLCGRWPQEEGGGGVQQASTHFYKTDTHFMTTESQMSPVSGESQSPQQQPNTLSVSTESNFIAFGSAPRKEADSQPISQLVRHAVSETVSRASRQADRNTQFGFFRWQTRLQAVGRAAPVRTSNGRRVMHPVSSAQSTPCSNPSDNKLLLHKLLSPTPTPTPIPKKVISSFRG